MKRLVRLASSGAFALRSWVHKAGIALCVLRLLRDPGRLNEFFVMYDHVLALLGPDGRRALIDEVAQTPEARRALAERPRLSSVDVAKLAELARGTLGHAFAQHLTSNGITLDAHLKAANPPAWLKAEEQVAFFRAHVRETHDLWHVLTGFGITPVEELGVQAFNLAQVPHHMAPIILGGGLVKIVLGNFRARNEPLAAIVRGWLLGTRCQKLFGVRWDELWGTPLTEVRQRLGLHVEAVDELLSYPLAKHATAQDSPKEK